MTHRMSFMRLGYDLAARVPYGRNFLAVTDTVLAGTAIANLPQYGYGRMTKNPMRSYTNVSCGYGLRQMASSLHLLCDRTIP